MNKLSIKLINCNIGLFVESLFIDHCSISFLIFSKSDILWLSSESTVKNACLKTGYFSSSCSKEGLG